MRRILYIVIAFSLAAAFPLSGWSSGSAESGPCPVTASGGNDCCETSPAAPECPSAHCVGAGAALPLGLAERGYDTLLSDPPAGFAARGVVRPARAPETAPPKSVA